MIIVSRPGRVKRDSPEPGTEFGDRPAAVQGRGEAGLKTTPRTGQAGEVRLVVDASNRISFADDRMPAVLATPWLVAALEQAARRAIEPDLEPHERSVGTFLEVEHLAPTPEGMTVTCRARVIHVAGAVVTFQVDAHDGVEPVARGLHRRRVIDADRFARRVARKRPG
jgi:predicted thioesterase